MPILEETVTIPGEPALPAFLARPEEEGPHPAVIIIHEIFGITENIRRVARKLAESGYVAVAPDLFRHEPTDYDSFEEARKVAASLSDRGAMADLGNTLQFLEGSAFALRGKTALVGFCMGGRIAFLGACLHAGKIKACVDFYGARKSGGSVHQGQTMVPLEESPALSCPVLLFYGGKDPFIPAEEVEAVEQRLTGLGKQFQVQVYPDADHGFLCEDRGSYHPEAAADAWPQTLKFLHDYIGEESVV